MVEPITIATIVGVIATFLLNLYQSVKSRHFTSSCCGDCCTIAYDSEHQEKEPVNKK
jgi:hypothetical protein